MTKQKDKNRKFGGIEHLVEENFECDLCGKYCESKGSLRTHKYQEHTGNTVQKDGESEDSKACFDCDNCGKSYSSKGSLRNHKHEHKREEQLKSVKDEAQGEFVESITKYDVHRPRTVINANVSRNSFDESSGNDMDSLDRKIDYLIEKREEVWACMQCGKNDKSKFHIRRHVEIHIGGFTFNCNKCEKNFPHRNALKAHVLRSHPEERTVKPYNCDSCNSSHKNSKALKEHNNRSHKGDSSYVVENGYMEAEIVTFE